MIQFPLSSQRLQVRLLELSDLPAVHQLHAMAEVDEFNTLGIPENESVSASIVQAWVADHQVPDIRNYTFAIVAKTEGQLIGLMGFNLAKPKYRKAEVWYKLHPDHWGRGYATEAVQTVLDFGFDRLGLHRIVAGCAVENKASIRVLEKVGMTREGRCRESLPLKSGWSDNYEYAILESDKRKRNS